MLTHMLRLKGVKLEFTVDYLKTLISYDAETGKCYRIGYYDRHKNYVPCNYEIKGVTRKGEYGYIRTSIDGKRYVIHKLIYFYMTGEWCDTIDHIDGDCRNNKFSNLRSTDRLGNMSNLKLKTTNQTGYNGVAIKYGKYYAHAQKDNKRYFRGYFSTIDEAIAARKELDIALGFHENHGKVK